MAMIYYHKHAKHMAYLSDQSYKLICYLLENMRLSQKQLFTNYKGLCVTNHYKFFHVVFVTHFQPFYELI